MRAQNASQMASRDMGLPASRRMFRMGRMMVPGVLGSLRWTGRMVDASNSGTIISMTKSSARI